MFERTHDSRKKEEQTLFCSIGDSFLTSGNRNTIKFPQPKGELNVVDAWVGRI